MISRTAEYALRAVVHLAAAGSDALPQSVAEIASDTRVPVGYLSKVMQSLVRAGVVTSQRGVGGGFQLAKSPEDVTIYEVIEAVEPIQRIRTCPLGLESHGTNLCPLHRRLDSAMSLIEEQFRSSRIIEVLETNERVTNRGTKGRPCRFPL